MSNSTPARGRALKTTAVLGLAALAVTGCRSTVGTNPTAGGTKTTAAPAPSSSAPFVDATPAASASQVATTEATTEASASIDPNSNVQYGCVSEDGGKDAVTVTYGAQDGATTTTTRVPFQATAPLDTTAASYSINIQLHGYGDVRCVVSVTYPDNGFASSVAEAAGTDTYAVATVLKTTSGYYGNQ